MSIRIRVLSLIGSFAIALPFITSTELAYASTEAPPTSVEMESLEDPEIGVEQEQAEQLEPSTETEEPEAAALHQTQSRAGITSFPYGTTRLAGSNRYMTAIAVSERFQPNVPAVFIATAGNFPDALSASSAAALIGAPLLLTSPNGLPAEVQQEIIRLNPGKIYVLGGTNAVSQAVQNSLSNISQAEVFRLGGSSRYDTGLTVVNEIFTTASQAIIATGTNFPDALAASGAAGASGAPVILVNGYDSSLDSATMATLQNLGVSRVAIAGGPSAVSNGIEQQLARNYSVTRYGGGSRFDTAASINQAYFPPGSTDTIFLATGFDFPDALSGSALAGQLSAPLYIATATCVPTAVYAQINQLGASKRVVLGGTNALSDQAANNFECPPPPVLPPGPVVTGSVSPGAFCAAALRGWYGYTVTGVLMICSTAWDDTRLRWRAA